MWPHLTTLALAAAPLVPELVAPVDGATAVGVSPTLAFRAADPDGDLLTLRVELRPAWTPGPDFSLVVLPDTQNYTCGCLGGTPEHLTAQISWILEEQTLRDVAYVAQVGDCVENGDEPLEWERADAAFSLLEDPVVTGLTDGLPYGISVGNNDQEPTGDPTDASTELYNLTFGTARFEGRSWYGGRFGDNHDNHYERFEAGGLKFLVVHLEYDPAADPAVMAWASGVIAAHPDRAAIVVSHHLIDTEGEWGTQGLALWEALRDQRTLILMLSGHVHGEGHRAEVWGGRTVHALLSDYQHRVSGGDGWLRILTVSPTTSRVAVETYSPTLDAWESDEDSQMTIDVALDAATWTAAAELRSRGGWLSVTAEDLEPDQDYEWRVVLDDGTSTTVGPTWSFTTGRLVRVPDDPDDSAPVGEDTGAPVDPEPAASITRPTQETDRATPGRCDTTRRPGLVVGALAALCALRRRPPAA